MTKFKKGDLVSSGERLYQIISVPYLDYTFYTLKSINSQNGICPQTTVLTAFVEANYTLATSFERSLNSSAYGHNYD